MHPIGHQIIKVSEIPVRLKLSSTMLPIKNPVLFGTSQGPFHPEDSPILINLEVPQLSCPAKRSYSSFLEILVFEQRPQAKANDKYFPSHINKTLIISFDAFFKTGSVIKMFNLKK